MDDGVAGLGYAAWVLWNLGYSEQALQRTREMLTLAQDIAHPLSRAWALNSVAWQYQFRREAQNAKEWAEAEIALCTEHGFAQLLAVGTIVQGWAVAAQGRPEEGIRRMREGLSTLSSTGTEIGRTRYLVTLAEAYGALQQIEIGLALLDEALAAIENTAERFYEAELYRLKGELLLKSKVKTRPASKQVKASLESEAEECFRKAIKSARHQHAKSLELRAVVSLSRLWQRQSKKKQARRILAEIYCWFTEGLNTVDLREAKGLLDELT
jgi:predicted ATPase